MVEYAQEMDSLMSSTLEDMIKEPIIGSFSADIRSYCEKLKECTSLDFEEVSAQLVNCFHNISVSKSALFPSSIRNIFYIGVNEQLNNRDFRQELKCNFNSMIASDDTI